MPFTDTGKWYRTRRLDHSDTWKMASEQLADGIETFLFAADDPGYGSYEFLSWLLARYDATKNSSGNIEHGLVWDPDDPMLTISPIDKSKLGDPGTQFDSAIRYSDDARASSEVDTDPVDMSRAADDGFPIVPEDGD